MAQAIVRERIASAQLTKPMATCAKPADQSETNSYYFCLSTDILNDRLSVIIKELQIQIVQATNLHRVTGVDQEHHLEKATRALNVLQDI